MKDLYNACYVKVESGQKDEPHLIYARGLLGIYDQAHNTFYHQGEKFAFPLSGTGRSKTMSKLNRYVHTMGLPTTVLFERGDVKLQDFMALKPEERREIEKETRKSLDRRL